MNRVPAPSPSPNGCPATINRRDWAMTEAKRRMGETAMERTRAAGCRNLRRFLRQGERIGLMRCRRLAHSPFRRFAHSLLDSSSPDRPFHPGLECASRRLDGSPYIPFFESVEDLRRQFGQWNSASGKVIQSRCRITFYLRRGAHIDPDTQYLKVPGVRCFQ